MNKIRVALIEDHDLTRIGLQTSLKTQEDIEFLWDAANAVKGLKLLESNKPDVAIIDIGLPDIDGIELTRMLRASEEGTEIKTKVLILTMHDNEESVLAAFAAGADSYCMKDINVHRLVEAIHSTYEGNAWIDPLIARVLLQQLRYEMTDAHVIEETSPIDMGAVQGEPEEVDGSPLTERELEVLQLIVGGYSNAVIANKLCVDDRTQAAVIALRSGLVS
jgi:DNA-binding NarL/FixJ family response regulator